MRYSKIIIWLLGLLFSLYYSLTAQSQEDILQDLQIDVVYLASDHLQGRETGTVGEELAARYITKRFKQIGLTPKGEGNTYVQPFAFNFSTNPHNKDSEARIGKNIIGFLDNGAPTTVIIGAHFDHIGRGAFGSRFLDGPVVHNGADDNASGVGVLLYLADALKKSNLKNNNYLFIAFSGEELGLYGSKHFVKQPTIALNQVNYMLNMDMVGRLRSDKTLIINGAGTSPAWKETFPKIKGTPIKIETFDSGTGPSDHTSFYLADIPVLHFFTGTHQDYHKPTDDSELINYEGMHEIADFMLALIAQLDKKGKIDFTKTKDDSQRQAASFRVTLGILPDYSYGGEGMLIDAVLDDRPAHAADIQKGDIVIKMGDKKVKDIFDYMEGLSQFNAGDTTTVVIKRGKSELKKKITF